MTKITSQNINARPISRGVFNAISMILFLVSGLISVSIFSTIFHLMLDQKPDLMEPYNVRMACFQSPRASSMEAIMVEKNGEIQLNKKSGNRVSNMRIISKRRTTAEKTNCVGIGLVGEIMGLKRSTAKTPTFRESMSATRSRKLTMENPVPINWSVLSSQWTSGSDAPI